MLSISQEYNQQNPECENSIKMGNPWIVSITSTFRKEKKKKSSKKTEGENTAHLKDNK